MKTKLIFVFALALLLPGCVPSVNPLYTEKDLIFDPALVGVWAEGEDKEAWAFEQAGDKKYILRHTDDEGIAKFDAHLLKLGQQRFLDLHLTSPGQLDVNSLAAFAMIIQPGHLFLKVDQVSPTLQLRLMNGDTVLKLLEKNPKAVRHQCIKFGEDRDQLVLTAKTKDLQQFVLKHMNDKDFFCGASDLQRKPASAAVNP